MHQTPGVIYTTQTTHGRVPHNTAESDSRPESVGLNGT
jgi:hypothetical protein